MAKTPQILVQLLPPLLSPTTFVMITVVARHTPPAAACTHMGQNVIIGVAARLRLPPAAMMAIVAAHMITPFAMFTLELAHW